MEPDNLPPSPQTPSWETVEQIVKFGTGGIAIIYTFGFLVVSIAHARYGIVLFDLFRARVLSSGLLISLFVVLPVVTSLHVYGRDSRISKFSGLGYFVFGITVIWTCVIIAFNFYPLFPGNSRTLFHITSNAAWWMLVCISIVLLYVRASEKHRISLGLFAVAMFGLMNFCAAVMFNWTLLILAMWFVVCGAIAMAVSQLMDNLKAKGSKVVWYGTFVGYAIVVVIAFTHLLYFKIKPAWGGGLPQPVTVNLTRSIPFSNSGTVQAFLVDETDKGFYLIHNVQDHKASFVPRDTIGSIDFEEVR